jgi:hypothetical protein
MWQLYVYSFLAGIIGANGVPHFVRGISGKKYQTPFGKNSSAIVNVTWGWVNFVVAGMLVYSSGFHAHILRAFALIALGALVTGVISAAAMSQPAKSSK